MLLDILDTTAVPFLYLIEDEVGNNEDVKHSHFKSG